MQKSPFMKRVYRKGLTFRAYALRQREAYEWPTLKMVDFLYFLYFLYFTNFLYFDLYLNTANVYCYFINLL